MDITEQQKEEIFELHKKKINFEKISKMLQIKTSDVKLVLYDFGVRTHKPDCYDSIDRKCFCSKCRKYHIKRVNYIGPKEFPPYFCDPCRYISSNMYNPTGELDQNLELIFKNQPGELR